MAPIDLSPAHLECNHRREALSREWQIMTQARWSVSAAIG